jgi:hypothetical protein
MPYNRGMNYLDILIPFGLPPAELSTDLLRELNSPALATLIARAKSAPAASRHETFNGFSRWLPHELWLARQFGQEQALKKGGSPPVASALMHSFGLQPEAGTWFVLQPVHLHIAHDHLVLADPRQLMLSDAEAHALFDIAKPLFDETGRQLHYGNASTWFLHADDWKDLQTSSPDAAGNHNIDIWMPHGPGEREWRKVQNDVQMHWFNHPLNEEREARRLKPVNSLWLWGGGTTAEAPRRPNRYTRTLNFSGWTKAYEQSVSHHADVKTATDLMAISDEQKSLLILDALLEPTLSNDWSRWLEGMKKLEAEWFAPLLDALKSGTVDQVSLILTHDARISHFATTRPSLRKFWVKPSLAPLCP